MQEKAAVVIVAAGSSRRMQGKDKLWLPLAGRITLAHTIAVFQRSPIIDTIVLVINAERLADAGTYCKQEGWSKIAAIVAGGARRQDSVRIGHLRLRLRRCPTTGFRTHRSRHAGTEKP